MRVDMRVFEVQLYLKALMTAPVVWFRSWWADWTLLNLLSQYYKFESKKSEAFRMELVTDDYF